MKAAIRGEKGQALALVLILLLVGGLIVSSLLANMGNGLLNGRAYEKKTAELYAADAGIEDALWRIKNVELTDFLSGYDEYDYSTPWPYPLEDHQGGVAQLVLVNDKAVNVTIENVWMPMDIPAPDPGTARGIAENTSLIITGSVAGASQYQIKISYDPTCAGPGNARVNTVGIWLPPGFGYVMGSSDLEKAVGKPYYSAPDVTSYKGGYAVVWNFASYVTLNGFPGSFTFQYSGPQGQEPGAAVPWIEVGTGTTASGSQTRYPSGDISHSGTWDKTTKMYSYVDEVGANDGDTTYLVHGTSSGSVLFSFPAFAVPSGATIQSLTVSLVAKDNSGGSGSNNMGPVIRVGGSNYNGNYSNVQNSYNTISYTWTTNPRTHTAWTVNDINGVGSNALQGFGVYSTDANPQIRLTQVYAKVDYTDVNYGPALYTWDADVKVYKITSTATDPNTGSQTTVESYSSKVELRQLGSSIAGDYVAIGGTLMTPKSTDSSNDQKYYRGQLLMGSSCPLASGSGVGQIPADATVQAAYLYWSGWIDYHYWYKSSSGGQWNWGEIPELKYGNYANNTSQLIANAKVNTVKFGGGGVLTNISATQWQVQENSDQASTWSYSCFYDATDQVKQLIKDGKLGSNGAGTYTLQHADAVVAPPDSNLRSGYPGKPNGTTNGNYYSFYLGPGNTTYTGYPLGTPATKLPGESSYSQGETRYQWAYAGWSLIIIYSSPETKGHQLYLFDDFRYVGLDTTLNFTISGFLAPASTAGSHLTYFVGEGDYYYVGEYIALNNYKLPQPGDPYEVPPVNPQNNPFNSYSNSIGDQYISGIDIDTFDISTCVKPADTSATVVLDNGQEIYDLVYLILSFRSAITTGGVMGYLIMG
jgi:hypothetical protein